MLSRLRQLLRRGHGEEGAAAVEFALVLPFLMILLAGFIDFGWLFYWQHTVTNASRAGARYGVQANYLVTGTPPVTTRTPHTADEITTLVQTLYGTDLEVKVVPGTIAGTPLSVKVTKTMQWFFLGILQRGFFRSEGVPLPTTVHNTTTMTME